MFDKRWFCKYFLPSRGDEQDSEEDELLINTSEEEDSEDSETDSQSEVIETPVTVPNILDQQGNRREVIINMPGFELESSKESRIRKLAAPISAVFTITSLLLFGGSWPLILPAAMVSFAGTYFFTRRYGKKTNHILNVNGLPIDLLSQHELSITRGVRILAIGVSSIVSGLFAFVITDGGLIIFFFATISLGTISSSLIRNYDRRIRSVIDDLNIAGKALIKFDDFGRRIGDTLRIQRFFENQVTNARPHSYDTPDRASEAILRGQIQNYGVRVFATLIGGSVIVLSGPSIGLAWSCIYGVGLFGAVTSSFGYWFSNIRIAQVNIILNEIIEKVYRDESLVELRRSIAWRFSIAYQQEARDIINSIDSNDPLTLVNTFFLRSVDNHRLRELLHPIILGTLTEDPRFARVILEAGAYVRGGELAHFFARFANVAPEFLWLIAEMPIVLLLRVVPQRVRAPLEIVIGAEAFRRADNIRSAVQAIERGIAPENVGNAIADNSLFNKLVRVLIYSLINLSVTVVVPWASLSGVFGAQSVFNISFGVGGVLWGVISSVLIYIKLAKIDSLVLGILPNSDRIMVFFGLSEGHTTEERRTEREYTEALNQFLGRSAEIYPQNLRNAVFQRNIENSSIENRETSTEPGIFEINEEDVMLNSSLPIRVTNETNSDTTSPLNAFEGNGNSEESHQHYNQQSNLSYSAEGSGNQSESAQQRLNDHSNYVRNYSVFFEDNTPKTLNLINFPYDDPDDGDDDLKPYSEEKELINHEENIDNFYDADKEYEIKAKKKEKKIDLVREDYEEYSSKDILPSKELYNSERFTDFLQVESFQYNNLLTPMLGLVLLSSQKHHTTSFF
jgi:hypothetical protein